VLIARVAAETSTIRIGSGGVLLPHYSPLKVAETFRTLHALYPDRIDLGVGRAPGGTPLDAYALRYRQNDGDEDYAGQLVELLAFLRRAQFPANHPFGRILVTPDMPGGPDVWLLGSSGWSADAAGQLGLPYAAAHFINPGPTRRSIEHYRRTFEAGRHPGEPRVIVAVGAVAAATDEAGQRLASSWLLRRILRERGERDTGPIPTPEDAIARIGEARLPPEPGEWPRLVAGGVERVAEALASMARALAVDELMLLTVVHDHAARRESYRLLAEAFGLARS